MQILLLLLLFGKKHAYLIEFHKHLRESNVFFFSKEETFIKKDH